MTQLLVVGPITRDVTVLVEGVPGPGEAADAEALYSEVGGKGANPALAAAALGAEVRLAGAVGVDEAGEYALTALRNRGIDVGAVARDCDSGTGQVVTFLEPGGVRRYVEWQGANERFRATREGLATAADGTAAVLVSGATPRPSAVAAVAAGRAAGALVALDAAGDAKTACAVLADVDVVRGDAAEVAALVDFPVRDFDSAATAGRRLLAHGPRIAVVQAGDEGDVVLTADKELRLPRLTVDVVDPTGGGDALIATFTVLLARGRVLAEAAELGSTAAAHTASHIGGQPRFDGEADLARLRSRPA